MIQIILFCQEMSSYMIYMMFNILLFCILMILGMSMMTLNWDAGIDASIDPLNSKTFNYIRARIQYFTFPPFSTF